MRGLRKIFYIALTLTAIGCAKRGTISGGSKDTIPPVLELSIPKNYSTEFTGNEIRLVFDEYVKLKDLDKHLIVSPPMNTPPSITPTGATKMIKISLKDTLLPNTTYSFNFGQSIEDNNESNPIRQFKYVFSTGPHIDSLTLSGNIRDAYNRAPDPFVTVMLYEADETYTDSAVFTKKPRYVTNTLDSATSFKFENLKAGRYKLIALKDNVANYKYDPKSDKIGFREAYVTVPGDSVYQLELFRGQVPFRALKPTLGLANRLIMGFEGNSTEVKVQVAGNSQPVPSVSTRIAGKDSLTIWHKPVKVDSLDVTVNKGDYTQTFNVKTKAQKLDTLSLSPKFAGALPLRSPFVLKSSRPLTKIDESLITIKQGDSVAVPFKSSYNELDMELTLDFKREPVTRYQIDLQPGALTDFYDKANDSLSFKVSTKNTSDYGNLRLTLDNVKKYPIIVELANAKGETITTAYATEPGTIAFDLLDPALYTVRVIYDENGNRRWDSGNFLEGRQAEQVIYFPKEIDVRANWDVDQPVTLP